MHAQAPVHKSHSCSQTGARGPRARDTRAVLHAAQNHDSKPSCNPSHRRHDFNGSLSAILCASRWVHCTGSGVEFLMRRPPCFLSWILFFCPAGYLTATRMRGSLLVGQNWQGMGWVGVSQSIAVLEFPMVLVIFSEHSGRIRFESYWISL